MTAPYRRTDIGDVAGNHERRIGILEAVAEDDPPTYYNPVMKHQMVGDDWFHYDDFGWQFGFYDVEDLTIPGGRYITSEGIGSTGDYMIFGAPIGPKGSIWGIDIGYGTGPSGGQMILEIQTQPIDWQSTLFNPQAITPPNLSGTWLPFVTLIEGYTGVFGWSLITSIGDYLTPYGNDGQMATANTVSTPTAPLTNYPSATRAYNGGGDGSVMWYFRFRTLSTVNAGNVTGDKDFWLRSIYLRRYNATGGIVF